MFLIGGFLALPGAELGVEDGEEPGYSPTFQCLFLVSSDEDEDEAIAQRITVRTTAAECIMLTLVVLHVLPGEIGERATDEEKDRANDVAIIEYSSG
jgi:hypothetical protein